MITLGHHPAVQRILDEWRHSVTASRKAGGVAQCSEEDLRRLIAMLEDTLDGMADQLDVRNPVPLTALLLTNWKWIRTRLSTIRIRIKELQPK